MSGLRLSGYEYKQFMRADWDALLGVTDAYMDAQEITVNDADEPNDADLIPDDAKVVIHSGCVLAEEVLDLSLISAYRKWRKSLSTIVMTIEVPKESVGIIKEMLKAHKVRVIS